ncbi:uncharacterized protein CIMG_12582 [Coccidioides immitis RS]|uniref:Uncharacterized protein n=1 Tax=Coccidioides immitis (strain RS) TaxID=246410 RepID=J3K038_COCIM|nr:uncharacterized protein CIMG_12582 [Coccidioides immitis RS]EAS27176.3 hypothetical protein CIMG_12582 [Coccidioides immitis RS]
MGVMQRIMYIHASFTGNNKKSLNNGHGLWKTSYIMETIVMTSRIASIANATLRKKNGKCQTYRIPHSWNIQIMPEFIGAFAITIIALSTEMERTADTTHDY